MKKIYLFVMMVGLFTTINFSAKAQAFEVGKSYVSVGYGVGNFVQSVFKAYETDNNYSFKMMGPIFGKYEYAINDQIGFGVAFSYVSANVSYDYDSYDSNNNPTTYQQNIDWSSYSILMRFNWHFNSMGDRLDPYIGMGVGYRGANWSYSDTDPNGGNNNLSHTTIFPLGMEVTAGMRFMFTDFLGVYAEVGLAKAVAQFGVVSKF